MKFLAWLAAFCVLFLALVACAPRAASSTYIQAGPPSSDMQRLLSEVNRARATARQCGSHNFAAAPPLGWNAVLTVPALRHAEDMNRYTFFSHDGTDGSSVSDRVSRTGYDWRMVGENLAYSTTGYYTPASVVADWLSSPGHCANIMQPGFSELGAVKLEGSYDFWVQVFATPK